MIISQIAIFAGAFIVLVWASRILISSLTKISVFLRISEYALAFIIMGIATSVPELFLAISSSAEGAGELSFGNVIGANVLNITLVIGLIAFIGRGIKSSLAITNNNSPILLFVILPFFLAYDGTLDWLDGVLLISLYFLYLARLVKTEEKFEKTKLKFSGDSRKTSLSRYGRGIIGQVFVFMGAIILLLGSSFLIISAARTMAGLFHFSLLAFGILIISLGTTVPELVFGIRSVMLKHDEMTVGNAFGSLAVNSTLVLGIASMVSPIHLDINLRFFFSAIFLISVFALFKVLLKGDKVAITKREGVILILAYVVFVLINSLI